MSRISWDAASDRVYEAGLDRGVLFVGSSAGVPWVGLTSVDEEPSGGEVVSYYMDGVKFLQVANSTEFQATISAFYAPAEFAQCSGDSRQSNGLVITNQPKVPFSFSYRTGLGNAAAGLDYGHKIHIVYNALVEGQGRTHSTTTDQTNVDPLSWKIQTLPPSIVGFKPTAHLVLDSTKAAAGVMDQVEDILYGSASTQPRLPTPAELLALT